MKKSHLKQVVSKAVTASLGMLVLLAYSMVTVASSNRPVGELTVTGQALSDGAFVAVNGEMAKTGRTVFTSSTITTPEGMGAMINFGKAGNISLGPNSTYTLTGDAEQIGGDLSSGSVTVLNAAESVGVKTLTGETVKLNAGETAIASLGKAARDHRDPTTGKCIDDNNNGKAECGFGSSIPPWGYIAIVGGIIAVVVIVVAGGGGNDSTPAISPVR
ncbi:MAG: hypothetical protein ABIO36_00615 [Pyrinomonadaceae bacterium]